MTNGLTKILHLLFEKQNSWYLSQSPNPTLGGSTMPGGLEKEQARVETFCPRGLREREKDFFISIAVTH